MGANLQLQGGSIYLEEYNTDGTTLQAMIYPGTTDMLSFNTDLEKIEHNDTEEEEQVLDGEDVIKRNMTIAFTTADINDTFNALAYLSSSTDFTQTASPGEAVTLSAVALDGVANIGFYDLSNLVVQDDTDTTTYVLGTDYTFDRKWGTFIALSTGSITALDDLHLVFDAAEITAGKNLSSFQVDKREYRMTYQGRSSKGRNERHVFEKVSIAMEGDRR